MTHDTKLPSRTMLPAAAIAALLLAGCSSGNVGESWQCPLADAGTCDSVAGADPAVPDMDAARRAVLTEPLWRVREGRQGPSPTAPCEADCVGFDPFAWLARLFGAGAADGGEKTAAPGPVRLLPAEAPASAGAAAPAAALPAGPIAANRKPGADETAPAPLTAEGDVPEIHARGDDPAVGDLRTDEVVARIWIAPFVDADGVYREASFVRVVLEPAGWRLGR